MLKKSLINIYENPLEEEEEMIWCDQFIILLFYTNDWLD